MDSDDDFEPLLPSSPVHEPKLKRLKKATRVYENPRPSTPPIDSPELEIDSRLEESNRVSSPELEKLGDGNVSVTVDEEGLGAKRVLDFDSVGDELDGKVTEKIEEVLDLETDELERKRRSIDDHSDQKENKKKKKKIDVGDEKKKLKESTSNKRKAEKERRETLKQLQAESQKLLRETRDAEFKPVPLVQKPISSILGKIRQRKLEILKKSSASFDDNNSFMVDAGSEHPCVSKEVGIETKKVEHEETPVTSPAVTENNLSPLPTGESNDAEDNSSHDDIPSPRAVGSESVNAFRAPIDDTQDLFSDSEIRDTNDEAVDEKLKNPSEEVFAPSVLAMNLKFDSAPLDDDDVSSDDEYNDKENMGPHLHGSAESIIPPSGDPVKAFVDEEAEEEDDSDNDLQRFQDNEEECEDDDAEELNDMIATEYEENPVDREKRDELHQKWLEQQDTAGMDNLLLKFNCGSKLKESVSIDEEDDESNEIEIESDDEDISVPSEAVKVNLKKVKQMIPLMFTDKDDAYVSEEETEERLAKQRLSYKVEEKVRIISPAEDESSRGVFSLIKKLNIVPDTKKKGRTPSIFDVPHIGQNINISSKSSFVGRTSNHFMPSSQKHGSTNVRSYIFGRDDSNSRTSVSISEDSSDTVLKESQPPKAVSAKFQRNTQNKYANWNSKSQKSKSDVSLLEILRSSSVHKAHSVIQDDIVQPNKSLFEAFKLPKKPITNTETRL